jgi:tRNA G18 (ribose-2'-O)-methylase SpoU
VTSNHVYADELTVHGEHDVKTWLQQDLKIESIYVYIHRGATAEINEATACMRQLMCTAVVSQLSSDQLTPLHQSAQLTFAVPCMSIFLIYFMAAWVYTMQLLTY